MLRPSGHKMCVFVFTFALGSCATLRLVDIIEARNTRQQAAMTGLPKAFYTLTYRTSPGGGVFQAIVAHVNTNSSSSNSNSSTTVEIHSDVLRLNSYAGNSGCVQHIVYKKWCHCESSKGSINRGNRVNYILISLYFGYRLVRVITVDKS